MSTTLIPATPKGLAWRIAEEPNGDWMLALRAVDTGALRRDEFAAEQVPEAFPDLGVLLDPDILTRAGVMAAAARLVAEYVNLVLDHMRATGQASFPETTRACWRAAGDRFAVALMMDDAGTGAEFGVLDETTPLFHPEELGDWLRRGRATARQVVLWSDLCKDIEHHDGSREA